MEVIDTCKKNNGDCDHICKHTANGALCSCHRGYQLAADGKTCEGKFYSPE